MPRAPVPRSCAKLVSAGGGDNPPGSCGLYVQLRPVGLRKGAKLFLNVVFAHIESIFIPFTVRSQTPPLSKI